LNTQDELRLAAWSAIKSPAPVSYRIVTMGSCDGLPNTWFFGPAVPAYLAKSPVAPDPMLNDRLDDVAWAGRPIPQSTARKVLPGGGTDAGTPHPGISLFANFFEQ
jgi:hypothetical protein